MSKKMVIVYVTDTEELKELEYNEQPPSFYNGDQEYIIFAKGLLAENNISYSSIREIYTTTVHYDAYEKGLQALRDLENES